MKFESDPQNLSADSDVNPELLQGTIPPELSEVTNSLDLETGSQLNKTLVPPPIDPIEPIDIDRLELINENFSEQLPEQLPKTALENGLENDPEIIDDENIEVESPQLETVAQPSRHSWLSMLKGISSDLQAAGISKMALARETVRSSVCAGLRWGGEFALISLGVQAVADKDPMALAYLGAWAGCGILASCGERIFRARVDDFERDYTRQLNARILERTSESSLADLNNSETQAKVELHIERKDEVAEIVETAVELPSNIVPICLSTAALMTADWRVSLIMAAAVLPTFWVKNRQAKADLVLQEQQAKTGKVVDSITDEAYSPLGTVRMILGRLTQKVRETINSAHEKLDKQTTEHELKQARNYRPADFLYYGGLATGLALLFSEYQAGALGIGGLSFLCMKLVEFGDELEDHGQSLQEHMILAHKTKAFYEFTERPSSAGTAAAPKDFLLKFENASFTRGDETETFTVELPDFSLEPGDFLVIHGASGAGKTTILKHLAFGATPDTGDVRVGDTDIKKLSRKSWLENIAYCGATPSLLQGLTVAQAFSLDPDGEAHLEARLKHPLVADLIKSLEGGHGLNTRIGAGLENSREFSTGELQRISLVCSMVPGPKILFLDEVSSNQSDDFVEILSSEITRLREAGTTVIFATHSKQFDSAATHLMKVSRGVAEVTNRQLLN